jgi:hypothetical protein
MERAHREKDAAMRTSMWFGSRIPHGIIAGTRRRRYLCEYPGRTGELASLRLWFLEDGQWSVVMVARVRAHPLPNAPSWLSLC